jgi:hypothetical protein
MCIFNSTFYEKSQPGVYTCTVQKSEEIKPHGRFRYSWENNIVAYRPAAEQ